MSKLSFPLLPTSSPFHAARRRSSWRAAALSAVAITAVAAACSKSATQQAPPPPEVNVVTVSTQPVANVIELPGRLQAVRTSEVRARVDGIVQRRLYTEGTDVQEGQPLFQIDPRQLQAQLNAAQAQLRRAQATEANAEQDVNRYKGLVAQQALSQQEYDAAVARQRTAQADVAQVEAQIAAAKLSLSYTTVTAPISGRAGRAEVTEGALVSAGAATLMTTIEQIDPIYANFAQSSADLLKLREQMKSGTLKLATLRRVPVSLVLEDGTPYPQQGQLDFVDMSIDEATGTAALRAQFPNPQRSLLPGQFVRGQIDAGVRPNGVMIPQRAVTVTPQGANVLVVGAKDIVESRPVVVGALSGDSWEIRSGLAAGERVIVDGLQKAQPGQPVRVVVAPPAPAATPNVNADAP
jgi:membrane fusion protein (multidrug efflux system)